MALLIIFPSRSAPQVLGEVAELDRLERRAEEAMAYGDPQGAALSIGKAALMSSMLGDQANRQPEAELWDAVTQLFRGQEETFRALALFEQTGASPPPPAGVCHALKHALETMHEVQGAFHHLATSDNNDLKSRVQRYRSTVKDWINLLPDLQQDLAC